MQKTELRTIPTDDLIPYARNSRTHSPDQVTNIAASIKEFGFLNPIIIKRWQNFTGQQAVLESTGQTYLELKTDREAA